MRVDGQLPNPNCMTESDAVYHPVTDRLTCLLRLAPSADATPQEKEQLNEFIYHHDPYQHCFDVVLVHFKDPPEDPNTWSVPVEMPRYLTPFIDEKTQFGNKYRSLEKDIWWSLFWSGFRIRKVPTRNSTLNFFAPGYKKIVQSTIPYQNGLQAIQMGGNAQGDNMDAVYRTSKTFCLTEGDIIICLLFQHSIIHNSLYNNLNAVDVNKAYGAAAVSFSRQDNRLYSIVLVGRDLDLLNQTRVDLLGRMQDSEREISMHIMLLPTGDNIEGKIPLCHQILLVERTYLNSKFVSPSSNRPYDLYHVFGNDLSRPVDSIRENEDIWEALKTATGISPETMLAPVYLKATRSKNSVFLFIGGWVILVVILLTIGILISHKMKKKVAPP